MVRAFILISYSTASPVILSASKVNNISYINIWQLVSSSIQSTPVAVRERDKAHAECVCPDIVDIIPGYRKSAPASATLPPTSVVLPGYEGVHSHPFLHYQVFLLVLDLVANLIWDAAYITPYIRSQCEQMS